MTDRITVLCIDDEHSYTEVLRSYLVDIFDREFELEIETDPGGGAGVRRRARRRLRGL